jgi:hypothetical protein
MMKPSLQLALLLAISGCGQPGADSPTVDGATTTAPDLTPDPDPFWVNLQTQGWIADPGKEIFPAMNFTANRDYTIAGIRAVAPPGTHHVVLLRNGGTIHNVLFVAVVGTGELDFPDGIGLIIKKGDSLELQLHVVNAGTSSLTGVSGVEVKEVDHLDIEANLLNPAVTTLNLPPGPSEAKGTCTLTGDQTLFAIGPHMHQLGKHISSTYIPKGSTDPQSILDENFHFNEQAFVPLQAISAHAGDQITVDCQWDNTTAMTVTWGGDANQEMCSLFIYRYPAGDSDFCTK